MYQILFATSVGSQQVLQSEATKNIICLPALNHKIEPARVSLCRATRQHAADTTHQKKVMCPVSSKGLEQVASVDGHKILPVTNHTVSTTAAPSPIAAPCQTPRWVNIPSRTIPRRGPSVRPSSETDLPASTQPAASHSVSAVSLQVQAQDKELSQYTGTHKVRVKQSCLFSIRQWQHSTPRKGTQHTPARHRF